MQNVHQPHERVIVASDLVSVSAASKFATIARTWTGARARNAFLHQSDSSVQLFDDEMQCLCRLSDATTKPTVTRMSDSCTNRRDRVAQIDSALECTTIDWNDNQSKVLCAVLIQIYTLYWVDAS